MFHFYAGFTFPRPECCLVWDPIGCVCSAYDDRYDLTLVPDCVLKQQLRNSADASADSFCQGNNCDSGTSSNAEVNESGALSESRSFATNFPSGNFAGAFADAACQGNGCKTESDTVTAVSDDGSASSSRSSASNGK